MSTEIKYLPKEMFLTSPEVNDEFTLEGVNIRCVETTLQNFNSCKDCQLKYFYCDRVKCASTEERKGIHFIKIN